MNRVHGSSRPSDSARAVGKQMRVHRLSWSDTSREAVSRQSPLAPVRTALTNAASSSIHDRGYAADEKQLGAARVSPLRHSCLTSRRREVPQLP